MWDGWLSIYTLIALIVGTGCGVALTGFIEYNSVPYDDPADFPVRRNDAGG